MKILYLGLRSPLDPAQAATGNQVREAGLCCELRRLGHEVMQMAPASSHAQHTSTGSDNFNRKLVAQLTSSKPDAIIVGYWSLLAHLPYTEIPVILDFIAPRLLEAMFQEGGVLIHESQAILELLPRADHFLVGNQRQADLLLSLLLLAGFDCRERTPVSIVPISTSGASTEHESPQTEIRLISAGVDWPWRQSADYFAALANWCETNADFSFTNITGSYPGADNSKTELLPYAEMQRQFQRSHIGLELSARNTEREFSHSFRIVEYLQCSLPVIANSWLPIAPLLREFDAGWLIEAPEQLLQVLNDIEMNPAILQKKAAGAKRLADTCLNYQFSSAELLRYLEAPWRPQRELQSRWQLKQNPDENRTNSRREKLQAALVLLYRTVFCRKRPVDAPDILVVTRSDLFPTDHGAAVKIVRTAEALSRLQRKVYLCTDNRREYYCFDGGKMVTLVYPFWLRLLAVPRRISLYMLLLRGYPVSDAFLYLPLTDFSYTVRALYLATRHAVGNYIAEFPAYVQPCRAARKVLGGKILLVEHNVEYARLREQGKIFTDQIYQALKETELRMCRVADAVVTVSENDKGILLLDGVDRNKVHTIAHGVDLHAFRNAAVQDVRRMYGIAQDSLLLVYHGPYSYAPNLQAMEFMAREILPRLLAQNLQVEVLAIGSRPPAVSMHKAIHFVGAVPELASILPAADIAVVPLLEGGGTRMKVLDYFAAGVPVISTSKGVEGIPVVNGEQVIIADEVSVICTAIMQLAANPAIGKQLAHKAAAFVQESSWDNIAALYMPLLQAQH